MQNHSNEYEFAGFWVRSAAYVIDMTVVTAGLLIVRLVFIGINSLIAGTFLGGGILFQHTLEDITLYLLQVIYFILFTYYTGSTLGKRALNLQVIRADNEKLSLLTVIYRETIGRFLCGVILCVGYLLIGSDKEKRGLHDILCDTRVIYAKKVKVYPVYHRSLEGSSFERNQADVQEDIQAQWNRVLNSQKEEINPQNEEQNIEGES